MTITAECSTCPVGIAELALKSWLAVGCETCTGVGGGRMHIYLDLHTYIMYKMQAKSVATHLFPDLLPDESGYLI